MSDDNDEFPGGPTNLEFWSLEIPPGKTIHAKIADIPNVFEIVHITGCALGDKPSKEPHVLKVVPTALDGSAQGEVALGTLQSGRTDQFPVDFGISRTTDFKHTGKSTVYLSGYLTRSYGSDDEYEEEDSESEDDEDEEAPDAIPLANGGIKAVQGLAKAGKPAAAAAESESDDEGESDEDESDDEGESDEDEEDEEDLPGDEYDRRLGAKSFEGAGDSSSSDDEEDEDSGDPLDIDSDDDVAVVQYDAAGRAGGPPAMDVSGESDEDESDEGEDEDDSDDEGESDEDEDESDREQPQPTPAKPSGKRPQQQPLTPQPQQQAAKRQKGEGGAKLMPQSAPAKATQAKTAAAAAGGGAEQQFLSALVAHLRLGGPTDLSHLAGKVSKPKELAVKYKAFLAQHPETFKLDGDKVSLNAK